MSEFIEEIGIGRRLGRGRRGLALIVAPVERALAIEADPQVLAAVVGESRAERTEVHRAPTQVTLKVRANADRVLVGTFAANVEGCRGTESAGSPRLVQAPLESSFGMGLGVSAGAEPVAGRLRSQPGLQWGGFTCLPRFWFGESHFCSLDGVDRSTCSQDSRRVSDVRKVRIEKSDRSARLHHSAWHRVAPVGGAPGPDVSDRRRMVVRESERDQRSARAMFSDPARLEA